MDELHQKYNLRSRNKNITTTPIKKILPREQTNEAVSKVVKNQIVITKTIDTQSTKKKSAETPVVNTQKVEVPVAETKSSQKNKVEKKGIESQITEIDKTTGNFNLENKINKIKIPIPLVKLAKNLI
jgi:hypothetical protein